MKMKVLLVLFVATILVASQCHGYKMFPLQMKMAQYTTEISRASWRLGVEAVGEWRVSNHT